MYCLYIFCVYLLTKGVCMQSLSSGWPTKAKETEGSTVSLYKVSSCLFFKLLFRTRLLCFKLFFPSSGDSFSSHFYRSCYSCWSQYLKGVYVSMAVDMHVLFLLFFFFSVCVYKRITSHFLTSMSKENEYRLFFFLFSFWKITQDKFVYLHFL
jgi:hypothetical protein